jgi:predicted naringenin-chalcone synthase
LRFRTQNGYLRNVLGKEVPRQAAEAMEKLSRDILARQGLTRTDVGHWIFHAGGEKILDTMEARLGLLPSALQSSRTVLRNFGNLSSPTVLFVLAEEMRRIMRTPSDKLRPRLAATDRWGLMASFGAGFSAHAALIEF